MRYIIRAVTPAAEILPVVDLDAIKRFMKVESDTDDGTIEGQALAAQEMVERHTSQVLTPRVMEMVTGAFPVLPELFSLPREPVTRIVSIKYSSAVTGAEIEMDSAAFRWADTAPDQVLPAFRQPWPIAAPEAGSVRVRFEAGYGEGLCPLTLIEAVKRTTLDLYDGRGSGSGLSDDVMRMCRPYRRRLI